MDEFNQFLDAMTMEELQNFHLRVIEKAKEKAKEKAALNECRERNKQERLLMITEGLKSKVKPVALNLGIVRARVGSTMVIARLSAYRSIKPESILFI
jgi:hypothetical protein